MRGPSVLVKTQLGMENIVASRIGELEENLKIVPSPEGFKGLVIVYNSTDKYELAKKIRLEIPEASKVLVIEGHTKANISKICEIVKKVVVNKISSAESFAVKTVRRGSHDFTSIDVNVRVGDIVRRLTGASVNLNYPDKIVAVEIIGGKAYISIYPGSEEFRKLRPGKPPIYKLLRRFSVVQMPYLGPLDACRTMGLRIGREIQTFEVRELVIAPDSLVEALQLKAFLDGLFEGLESRYEIQRKTYGRSVHKVPVYIYDIFQLVRSRRGEPIIVLEPEGEPASKLSEELAKIVLNNKRINLLIGSRVGIPTGIYRFADLIVDVAPGVTISTDYAAAAAIIAIVTSIYNELSEK